MSKIKVGLLPFYLELYDQLQPSNRRKPLEKFYADVAAALRQQGVEVVTAPICRVAPEFQRAVRGFERAGVDCLVTLHLAYSPSLESAAVLAATLLPVVVLDTTPDWDFGPSRAPAAIMANHGIHGVQDMCNLLLRNGIKFQIEAGHWQRSDVLTRVVRRVQAAAMAAKLRQARVGRIGQPFKGMGDFALSDKVLRRRLGLTVCRADAAELRGLARQVTSAMIERELRLDRRRFLVAPGAREAHRRSVRSGLTLRLWLEREQLSAFSMNFQSAGRSAGLPVMPFLEVGLAMGRGLGYAGEGDVLTAGLMGAVASIIPETTFTEMFCPDWRGGRVFLSHMGEWNVDLAARRPSLVEYEFVFGRAQNPVRPVGCLQPGAAVLVNLAPMANEQFRLILAPGRMEAPRGRDNLAESVHGWFRPRRPLNDFLADYSRTGGTHHSILVYGEQAEVLSWFGEWMGWDVLIL